MTLDLVVVGRPGCNVPPALCHSALQLLVDAVGWAPTIYMAAAGGGAAYAADTIRDTTRRLGAQKENEALEDVDEFCAAWFCILVEIIHCTS